jgi:hypothetical protein
MVRLASSATIRVTLHQKNNQSNCKLLSACFSCQLTITDYRWVSILPESYNQSIYAWHGFKELQLLEFLSAMQCKARNERQQVNWNRPTTRTLLVRNYENQLR